MNPLTTTQLNELLAKPAFVREPNPTPYTVYVGGEETMKKIAERGYIRVLNRNTMRYQDFGKDAKYIAVKDNSVETGWMVMSDRDVRGEAKEQGYII